MATPSKNNSLDSAVGGNSYAGSAMEVYPQPVLDLRWARARGESSSKDFTANQELDHQKSPKMPDPQAGISYIADGCISIRPSVGEFVLANSGTQTYPGALIIQQKKSEFTSMAKMTKLGSPDIRTLTGLRLNPASVRRPSSSVTPERGWKASMFPVLSRFNIADWAVVVASKSITSNLLSSLNREDTSGTTTVHRERKDLGTLIVENQDFEQRILNGTVHSV